MRTTLEGADLTGTDLRGAAFSAIIFAGVRLTGARLEGVNLRTTAYDRRTQWPSGFHPRRAGAVELPRQARISSISR